MKKGTSFKLLTVGIVAAAVVGCSNKPADSGNAGGATANSASSQGTQAKQGDQAAPGKINLDKKYTVKLYQWGPKDVAKDDAIIQYLDKKFNIDLKVERILAKEYDKNLELRIASGDMPDIFRYHQANAQDYKNLYEDGYLLNFTEYANKYDLKGIKEYTSREGMSEYAEKDGFYQLPTYHGKELNLLLVRQDWLDKLGLASPKTWAEFKDVMKAFKDNKLGGSKTVPLVASFGVGEAIATSPAWTGVASWGKVNGKWMNERVMPEFKDALVYWKDMYQQGLLDQEIFTNNETQENAKFINGQAGVIITPPNRLDTLKEALAKANPAAKLGLILPWPAGPKGAQTTVQSPYLDPVVVVKKGKDEDFLARLAALEDYMHTEEGIKILNYGIEGIHYNMKDGKMVRTELYDRDVIPTIGSMLAMDTDYAMAKADVSGLLKESYDQSEKIGIASPITSLSYGDAQSQSTSFGTKYDEWLVKFITGKSDPGKDWDAYVKDLNAAGLAKLTEAVNKNAK